MKYIVMSVIAVMAAALTAPKALSQDLAIKAHGDIGLGKGMSLTPSLYGMTTKSSSNAFGVDFGYTFWRQGGSSLEANIGLGYRTGTVTVSLSDLDYSYAAPAEADEDGNPYDRYISLSDVNQKIGIGYLEIPLYLEYQYKVTKWLGIHAEAGFGLGVKCSGAVKSTSGNVTVLGVYPEYDNLVIDAPYLNDFGKRELSAASEGKPSAQGFMATVICGAGLEFYVARPVSIEAGIRYNAGLTDVFKGRYDITPTTRMTAESAPVTYIVAEGQQVKALSDYLTGSRLRPLSLRLGINVRF